MSGKFTFKMDSEDNSVEFVSTRAYGLYDLIHQFEQFLRATGHNFDGHLTVNPEYEYTDDGWRETSKEVSEWFNKVPAFSKSSNKEDNFDLKDCFEIQDKLSTEQSIF